MANDKATEKPIGDAMSATVLRGVRPGDVVFIECGQPLKAEQIEALRDAIRAQLPDVRVFVLGYGLKVAAVAPEETTPTALAVALEKVHAMLTTVPPKT